MADELDQADALIQKTLELSLEQVKHNLKHSTKLPPIGECYFCSDEFSGEDSLKLFCDSVCANKHDHYNRVRGR